MAGIHLPDIGKLGIHIASGMNDKRKVAPLNVIENARLKAISNKIDSEKKDRHKVLTKEQKKMKIRNRRIKERLEDIKRSRGIRSEKSNFASKRLAHLPSLTSKRRQNGLKSKTGEDRLTKTKKELVSSSSISIFPIQEGFGNSLKCLNYESFHLVTRTLNKLNYIQRRAAENETEIIGDFKSSKVMTREETDFIKQSSDTKSSSRLDDSNQICPVETKVRQLRTGILKPRIEQSLKDAL